MNDSASMPLIIRQWCYCFTPTKVGQERLKKSLVFFLLIALGANHVLDILKLGKKGRKKSPIGCCCCFFFHSIALKWYVPIAFSSPMAQPEVRTFLVSYESSYFSHYNPKISASNSLDFGSYSRKCTYFRYTNFDFFNVFS